MLAPKRSSSIAWRAGIIKDPVERLRYLRRNARAGFPTGGGGKSGWRRYRWHLWAAAGILSALGPAYTISAAGRGRSPVPETWPVRESFDPSQSSLVPPRVWLIDRKDDVETFSNGLRIENRFATAGSPRPDYPVLIRENGSFQEREYRDRPAGIVFHTTESDQVPLEPAHDRALQRIGRELLVYVREQRSYHFVVDRFGRVFRIVPEADIAFHAGHSVWADASALYLNLNTSFLGIAVETQTQHGDQAAASPAQIHSVRVLSEMLRSKYNIDARDCVTHAQVSFNPTNRLIGYHTDWAANFPFAETGLPDNYRIAPASVVTLGLDYDSDFVNAMGGRLWPGLLSGERQLRGDAAQLGIALPTYKQQLKDRFKLLTARLGANAGHKEAKHEIN